MFLCRSGGARALALAREYVEAMNSWRRGCWQISADIACGNVIYVIGRLSGFAACWIRIIRRALSTGLALTPVRPRMGRTLAAAPQLRCFGSFAPHSGAGLIVMPANGIVLNQTTRRCVARVARSPPALRRSPARPRLPCPRAHLSVSHPPLAARYLGPPTLHRRRRLMAARAAPLLRCL